MTIIIFCGPTLRDEDRTRYPGVDYRPPVRQGELYAAARDAPRAIGIIDGYFDGVPAVWHKEVLWALDAGIAIFGAASMGALRAAELHAFGMQGVGRIFELYRDGQLTDDDDVALLHGPAETGYLHLSVPMVNVRATLDRAIAADVLSPAEAGVIAATAKAQFYQERTWQTVIERALDQLPEMDFERFSAWLPGGKADQKRDDALLLLEAIHDHVAAASKAPPLVFSFELTATWANAAWRNRPRQDGGAKGESAAILDELRLQGDAYLRIRHAALLRALAQGEITGPGPEPGRGEIARATMDFRAPRGLMRGADVRLWAEDNDTDPQRVARLMAETAGLDRLARAHDADLHGRMLDQLRLEDRYVALRDRARAKADRYAAPDAGAGHPLPPAALLSWYFVTELEASIPDDLADYVAAIGLPDVGRFHELLMAEYFMEPSDRISNRSGRTEGSD